MRRLIPEEKIAIGLTLMAMALGLASAWLYQRLWILALVPSLLFFILFIGFALGRGIDAIKEPDLSRELRWRKGLAIPLLVGGFWVLDYATGLTSRTSALIALSAREDEMREAERAAGPGRPAAIRYIDGIPDGGAAFIRWNRDPSLLPVGEQIELVGENIHRCRRIGRRDWLCGYD